MLEDRTLLNGGAPANQLVVAAMYQALLHRPVVDPVGLATWPAALERGLSTQDVALQIANSTEARTKQVQSLYGQYLHRQADPAGINAFGTALAAGQTLEQVAAAMVSSPEYFQTRAGGSASGFLKTLYGDVLGRDVDTTGQATFGPLVGQAQGRRQVADALFGSHEFRQNLVQDYYQYFLGRPADAAGLNSWTDSLRHGSLVQHVMAGIAGSPEMLGVEPVVGQAPAPAPVRGPGGGGPGPQAGRIGNPMPYQAFDACTVADTTNSADPNFGPFPAGGGTKTDRKSGV